MRGLKIIIGYALFRADGSLKWCYKERGKAYLNAYEGASVFPIGYDLVHETFFLEIPRRYQDEIQHAQFWCLAHDWIRKALTDYLIEHNEVLRLPKNNDDYIDED